jgi:hypothetical protein
MLSSLADCQAAPTGAGATRPSRRLVLPLARSPATEAELALVLEQWRGLCAHPNHSSCILKYHIAQREYIPICPNQATVAHQDSASERQRTNRKGQSCCRKCCCSSRASHRSGRREVRVGQLAQAEQRDTHLVVLLQLERAPREQRAHAPRLAQRVAVGVVQDHKLCRSRCRISS